MPQDSLLRSSELLSAADSRLVIIDMQEKLLPVIRNFEAVSAACLKLVGAAELFGVPVSASEQYPRGLGPTISPLADRIPERPEKLTFSAVGCWNWCSADVSSRDRHQIVIAGVEAHVCVLQTAMDLLSAGFEIYVVADAVSSRHAVDGEVALRRLADTGARIVTTEMVLFEWCQAAGTDLFRQVSRMVK